LCVQIPVALGDLLGEVHQMRLRRRARSVRRGPESPDLPAS
jgi:hypothetical protein